jgi:glutathione S-transferase
MSTYDPGARSPYVKHGIAACGRAFKMLEDTLAETGPWILGANVSLADISLMPFAARLEYLGLRNMTLDHGRYFRRSLSGPSLPRKESR